MKNRTGLNLGEVVYISIIYRSQILALFYGMVTIFIFDGVTVCHGRIIKALRDGHSILVTGCLQTKRMAEIEVVAG